MAERLRGRGGHGAFVLAFALAAMFAFATPASAETTHKYLYSFNTDGPSQVGGVDAEGNIYVFNSQARAVYRYDDQGNPVPFSGLGTNVIDGKGGGNCPIVQADCDQVPSNALRGASPTHEGSRGLAVDSRPSGVGAGYIYVASTAEGSVPSPGVVEVFGPDGRYKGQLDPALAYPASCAPELCGNVIGVSVDGNGHVYVNYSPRQVDQYAPTDPEPERFSFVGQLRLSGFLDNAVGGSPYSYVRTTFEDRWQKYDQQAWLKPVGVAPFIDFSPDPAPFGDGGQFPEQNGKFRDLAIDPKTQDVFLLGASDWVEKWDMDNNRIGPPFDGPGNVFLTSLAVDRSGGPNEGRLYMRGSANSGSSVAVFSPPVPIPDVTYDEIEPGHTTLTVRATVGLSGGPEVLTCQVEWGTGKDQFGNPNYSSSVPCDQPTPFEEETAVTATIPGLTPEAEYNVRVNASNENGKTFGAARRGKPRAVLGVETGDAIDVDDDSAKLTGSLNPDGMPTTYWFEYGLDKSYDARTQEFDAGAGVGQAPVEPVELQNLQPGKTYHYRLVAKNSLGISHGEDRSFQPATAPSIAGVRAVDMTETSADLTARINPEGYATKYRFEFGLTPEYGSTIPVPDAAIGDATSFVEVSQSISGLQPGVTYHFRVVAENQWGVSESENTTFSFAPPSCPNELARQQTGAHYLPDCRAYELVSPRDSGTVQLFPGNIVKDDEESNAVFQRIRELRLQQQNTGRATNPSRFSFVGGLGAVDGTNPPNTTLDVYVSTRTDQGWVTTYPGLNGDQAIFHGRIECSDALDRCIDFDAGPAPGETPSDGAPHLFDVSGRNLGRLPTNVGAVGPGTELVGDHDASADFGHYVFSSRYLAFAPGGLTEAPGSAYDNAVEARTVSIVSRQPGGDHISIEPSISDDTYVRIPAVSDDGSHILMAVDSVTGPDRLYMRVDDAVTYDVSKGVGVDFIDMTSDGSQVFFSTTERLTPDDLDSSADIFAWREQGDEIVRLSAGPTGGNSDDCNAAYTGGCNAEPMEPERGVTSYEEPGLDDYIASESGDIYFYSPEQLDPENPGVPNQRNLYVYRDGAPQYVTTLNPGTKIDRIQISPDGTRAAFLTAARLTGYDNQGWRQMYSYDALTGRIQCVSCIPDGTPPTIGHPDPPGSSTGTTSKDVLASQGGRFMSDDGRTFFTTSDALVDGDTNGKMDVYEFVDGRPQLITTGTSDLDTYMGSPLFPSQYVGLEAVSGDGRDVYFSTFETLVPQDENGAFVKFYNARTGGGFPVDEKLDPCAAADECHGPTVPTPQRIQSGTGAPLGSGGNHAAAKRSKKAAKRKSKRRAAKRKRRRAQAQKKRRRARALRKERRRG